MRGTGRIFKRGSTYWIAYCYRGKEHRESSHSDNEAQARKLLKKRVGEMGQGRLIGPGEGRLAFEDLASMLLTDYEVNGKRSLESAKLSVKHLREFFGSERAVDITLDRVRSYVRERQREGAANGSINRELAALKRAFTLYREEFVCIARHDHPVVKRRPTVAQIQKLTTVAYRADQHSSLFGSVPGKEKFDQLRVPQSILLPFLVQRSDAIALIQRHGAERFKPILNLQIIEPPIRSPRVEVCAW